jgi:hypothetical protein
MIQSKAQLASTYSLRSSSQNLDRFLFWLEVQPVLGRQYLRAWRFQRAFSRVFSRFTDEHPRWVNSLFDKPFLQRHLASPVDGDSGDHDIITPDALVEAWASQFQYVRSITRERYANALLPVATEFLDSLRLELEHLEQRR